MNIDDLIYYVTKCRDPQGKGPDLFHNTVFQENFLYRFKSSHRETEAAFYRCGYQEFSALTAPERDIWNGFIIRYTCFLLSNYGGMEMKTAVKNCTFKEALSSLGKEITTDLKNVQDAVNKVAAININTALSALGQEASTEINEFLSSVEEQKPAEIEELHHEIGEKIAIDGYLQRKIGIEDFVNSETFLTVIKMKDFFTQYKTPEGQQALKVLLLLAKHRGEAQATEVWNKWLGFDKDYCEKYAINSLLYYPWISVVFAELQEKMAMYQVLFSKVCQVCGETRQVTRHGQKATVIGRGQSVSHDVTYCDTYYGETAVAWLKSTGKAYLANDPVNFSSTDPGAGGCVISGTPILMWDLTTKPIETICVGDKVLNCHDDISRCSQELVMNPDVKRLYAVNGDTPFLSYEHAILTQRGWCALDPEAANRINPVFDVQQLVIGDVLEKYLVQNGKLVKKLITVTEINIGEYSGVSYDLHFYDGYRSYIANGYPCLLNYPDITAALLKEKLAEVPQEDRNDLLNNATGLLELVLGKSQVRVMLNSLAQKEGANL